MKNLINILIIEDDQLTRLSLKRNLEQIGRFTIEEADSKDQAVKMLNLYRFDLVFIDLDLDERLAGLEILEKIQKLDLYKIVTSSHVSEEIIARAYELGCRDYLHKPYQVSSLQKVLKRFHVKNDDIKIELSKMFQFSESERCEISSQIQKVITSDLPLMLLGETGTGKTKLVEFIHKQINEKIPLIHINCSEFSENLIESQLFGHEKGAFTGAVGSKKGVLELAHNGILFLDEIGTIPLTTQTKLLKAIEEKRFYPLGSEKMISSNFRIVTATCEDIFEKIKDKEFREDFYQRIKGHTITLLPLRQKRELVVDIIKNKIDESDRKIVLSKGAQALLKSYDWPGNLRELSKVMNIILNFDKGFIETHDVSHLLEKKTPQVFLSNNMFEYVKEFGLNNFIDKLESEILTKSLIENESKVRRTLLELKISNNTFYKIKARPL